MRMDEGYARQAAQRNTLCDVRIAACDERRARWALHRDTLESTCVAVSALGLGLGQNPTRLGPSPLGLLLLIFSVFNRGRGNSIGCIVHQRGYSAEELLHHSNDSDKGGSYAREVLASTGERGLAKVFRLVARKVWEGRGFAKVSDSRCVFLVGEAEGFR
ncbi:hypothetical protein AMTR_s00031p00178490 [Amborella trichopoda]|uniref:Uncharacterized protein n=1 Tax=Amborella trichopoda TaxID=13333 RepID=U5D881_AMBTC|nr:hypothetical protein AMTR_s00031p00178490 [Amborella trichopoda]